MVELILIVKDTMIFLFWTFLGAILLWLIVHLFMSIIKTIFCDTQIKLYRVWSKRLKKYSNDEELEKVLDEIIKNK